MFAETAYGVLLLRGLVGVGGSFCYSGVVTWSLILVILTALSVGAGDCVWGGCCDLGVHLWLELFLLVVVS